MSKKGIVGILLVAIVLIVVVKVMTPKPINWMESYSKNDKIPYGNTLLYRLLPVLFPTETLREMNSTPYEELQDVDTIRSVNLLYVTRDFDPDHQSTLALLNSVASGFTSFIAAEKIGKELSDSLGLSTDNLWRDSLRLQLSHPRLRDQSYLLRKRNMGGYFDSVRLKGASILGIVDSFKTNYLHISYGKGSFLLHTSPRMFCNYSVSDDTLRPYVFAALSYLPKQETWWDEYYKPTRRDDRSELRFIFSDRRLRAAYYVIIISVLLFFVFHTKRRQRVVPVIPEPRNATVDFVQTVGMLYYEHRDSASIIEKKVQYFYEFLRSRFYLVEVRATEAIMQKIASKSLLDLDEVRRVFAEVESIRNTRAPEDADVLRLHACIDSFKRRIQS